MKLFRKKSSTATRRQRLRGDDTTPVARSTFSYRARRSEQQLNTGRQAERAASRRVTIERLGRFWLQRTGLAILLLALIISAVNVVSLSTTAKVMLADPADSKLLLHDQKFYETAASKLLASSLWNRNKITINASELSRQLQRQFPELASVSVTLPFLQHRPIFYIQPAQPALVLSTSKGSFILDSSGKALIAAAQESVLERQDLPVVNDQSGLQVLSGQQALPADNVHFIQIVTAQLAAKKLAVASMSLPAAASELDVQVAGQPYFIKFNLQTNDAQRQAGTFLATQAQLQKQSVTPASYIDVRVPGRAYYQ